MSVLLFGTLTVNNLSVTRLFQWLSHRIFWWTDRHLRWSLCDTCIENFFHRLGGVFAMNLDRLGG